MSETPPSEHERSELPDVDERLVAPGSRYEIIDGQVVYVPPADEPHGTSHVSLGAIVKAHIASGFTAAVDMLTRTSRIDDIAPDVSVFPSARTAKGGRQLEVLAFEIASTQSLSNVADKARRLVERGVRRVFALDLSRRRLLEWSSELGTWSILERDGAIVDEALAVPMRIAPLLDAALEDDAIVEAFRAKHHPAFVQERAEGHREGRREGHREGHREGRSEGHREGLREGHREGHREGRREGLRQGRIEALQRSILDLLEARKLDIAPQDVARVREETDDEILEAWRVRAKRVASVAALFAAE